jgi:hypothetical protein
MDPRKLFGGWPVPLGPLSVPQIDVAVPPSPTFTMYAEARAGAPLFLPPFVRGGPPHTAENFRGQAPPAPVPTGRTIRSKGYLPRCPQPGEKDFERRMASFTEKLSMIVNSLIGQGILVQTGPSEWTIDAGAALVITTGGGGLTGTFP